MELGIFDNLPEKTKMEMEKPHRIGHLLNLENHDYNYYVEMLESEQWFSWTLL